MTIANVEIRSETPADIDAIDAVTSAAFLNAPHTDHTEQFIVKALRNAGQLSISLVAVLDGNVIGHVAISPVTISPLTPTNAARDWYGLGPISVRPEHQARGVGSLLMKRALADLRKRGAAGCVLLGDPKYYARFGFKPEPSLVLPDVPPQYFQALVFSGAVPAGRVTYHRALSARN